MDNTKNESRPFTTQFKSNGRIGIESNGLELSSDIKSIGNKASIAVVKNRESLRKKSTNLSNEVVFWDEQSLETKIEILGIMLHLESNNVTAYTTRDAIDGIVSEDMIHRIEDLI